MIDIIELNRRLYFSLEHFNLVLRRIYAYNHIKCEVLYDLTLKKVEIMKDTHVINRFDFSKLKTLNEWDELEHCLFDYLGDLVMELAQEKAQNDTEDEIDEDIPF